MAPSASKLKREGEDLSVGLGKRLKAEKGALTRSTSSTSLGASSMAASRGWLACREAEDDASTAPSPSSRTTTRTTAAPTLRQSLKKKETKTPKFAPCPVCLKLPTDLSAGQWNEYHNGKPINAGCKVDCKTAEYGYPSMTLQEVAAAYHDKGQPGFRAEFDGARNLLQVMLPKFPSIFPSSKVMFEQTNYVEQSYEVGFMTESDVARLLGYSPKDLKMGKGASLKLEDGSGRIQGWFCSLSGMSPEAAGSIRKIKVGSVISVKRDDVLMSKDTQLRPGQADEVMQMALQQSMESRYSAEKCVGRAHLASFASLCEKAERLKETAGGAADPTIEEDGPDDEEDDLSEECSEENDDGEAVEGEVMAPSLPKFSMGDMFNSATIKPKASAKKRGKANAKEEDTDSMLGEETGTMSEVDLLRELEGDMELKQVNKSLDRNCSCLVGLIPSKILAGNMRVGHQIKGARSLVKKLQAQRSPAATMLERRVDLVERLQVLMFRKIRSLPRPEVVAHTTAVQAFGCGLPFRVRLDILEVQIEGQCSDYFACNFGGEQLESMAADIVSKFCYWKKAEGQINESEMTIIHALTAEDDVHQQRRLANEITEDEEKGLKNSITEVATEVLMDSFGNTSVMTALADPGKFKHKILILMTEFSKFGMLFEEHGKDSVEADDVPVLIGNVARAFCVLLTPFAKYGASASHLQKVTSYKGTSVVMQAFKEIIQKNPLWQRFVNELVSKGAATATWGPKLDELVESLQNTQTFSAAFFAEAASLFPKMKSEMRSGSTDLLEKLLLLKTQSTAEDFLAGQTALRSVSMADALISCLGCFHASKGVLQLVSKLNSYKESNAVELAKQEIMDVLSSYPQASSELPVPDDAADRRKNISQIHDMLQQVALADEILLEMKTMAYWVFRGFYLQFREAVGIHPDELVSVLSFKDIVLQVEAYLIKSHSDIWDLDILKWMKVSLEVIMVASDFQKAKDGDLDPLLKCAKALDQALNKMAEMEEGWATQTLGEEVADVLQMLINCSWSTKAKSILQTSEFTDKLDIYTTSLKRGLAGTMENIADATQRFAEEGHSWKMNLEEMPSKEAVCGTAKDTLANIDGDAVETLLSSLAEVTAKAKKMAGSLVSLGREDPELKGLVSEGASTVKAIKILKAEGCLAVVMEKTMSSCSKTVLKWAQDIVRTMLLDLDESLIQPTLLDHCKGLLGDCD